MPRKLRAAAQAAAKSMKNVPTLPEVSDDDMIDAPPSEPSSPAVEDHGSPDEEDVDPEADANPEPEADADTAPEGDAAETPAESKQDEDTAGATPAADESTVLDGESPALGRPSIPRKRRIGRPPKYPRPEPEDGAESPLRVTTPIKRKRGRPAASGGRWARGRGPAQNPQVPIDKEGNMMDVIGDEVALPPNPIGDTKVDGDGHLLGGREYRVRTFTILNRDNKLYMLSTEPARCIGFRDSYLFFQKHKMLYKIIIDDDAKRDLIERDIIPHSYKGRAIGVVTARSVFREFGAKIVVGGKKITDDYDEQAARERGDVEGELAVPEDKLPGPGEEYNRNQYVAWHGASAVYHTGAPSVPMVGGKPVDPKKRRVPVTDDNWMLEHARAASTFNAKLAEMRRSTMNGVYEVHTNIMHYPQIMQPTHCRIERVPPPDITSTAELMTDMSTLTLANQNPTNRDTTPNESNETNEPTTPRNLKPDDRKEQPQDQVPIFPPVPAHISNRYYVQDIVYEAPPHSNMGIPGPDGDLRNLQPNGLVSIADPAHPEFMTPDILALLPDECKESLLDAATREVDWKRKWSTEATDTYRSLPDKSYAWYP
ncbi:Chromatin-remodelling complex RSC SWI/SNF subunit Rsc7/Swp82 [Penicillium argentinense]|uniref:Chromatin-remodelling complex RSC SWI/SNF subunit Rsc7/Swp82 n=1 Tax=Penicillium argentinense TaxID=1131581 RepID=A0A9W9EP77_9EURO|nr:Chromatin-remodelling complex RSC SWI/SNF subunit Rsc7/Swp82 [Penicillium argentinense]KAJ5085385.1 Chromatin-remodelling complex RSC SWI/SNF subunit Rsc7/Swp82 [Penicillium argentinense]